MSNSGWIARYVNIKSRFSLYNFARMFSLPYVHGSDLRKYCPLVKTASKVPHRIFKSASLNPSASSSWLKTGNFHLHTGFPATPLPSWWKRRVFWWHIGDCCGCWCCRVPFLVRILGRRRISISLLVWAHSFLCFFLWITNKKGGSALHSHDWNMVPKPHT